MLMGWCCVPNIGRKLSVGVSLKSQQANVLIVVETAAIRKPACAYNTNELMLMYFYGKLVPVVNGTRKLAKLALFAGGYDVHC